MDAMTIFNLIAGVASIVSLVIAISAKAEVKEIWNSQVTLNQTGSRNKQAGRDFHE